MIFPVGEKKYDWIPKVAEDEKIGVEAMGDEELRGFATPVAVEEVTIEEVPEEVVEDMAEECEDAPCEDIPGTPEDESLDSSGGDLEERVADVVDDVEAVKEKLDDVVEDVKEVAEMAGGDVVEDELEDELEEEVEVDIDEVSDVIDGELEAVTPGEVIEEEEEFCDEMDGVTAAANDKVVVAGEDRAFVKIASLTPENRKQIRTYWINVLGYDAEYVDAMVQDYEKK